ncbi:MAG: FAD-binding oxidoreductase [Gammaproteobacteria bacterium]|nr:FAD-binding oxidoreductase [Gammaproteobacteria bacterium]
MINELFTEDFKTTPYWWEVTPRPELPDQTLPTNADVVVIGAGYTGLSAALQTARAGRHTVVLDAEDAGWGCSTRNGGQISTSIKPSFEQLSAKYGAKRAFDILREGHNALAWIEDFITEEKIDCDFEVAGRFTGAHSPGQYEKLGKKLTSEVKGLESGGHLIPRSDQYSELGSDFYHGGIVHPKCASLDPAGFHQGMLERVLEAKASVISHCPATGLDREGDGFRVTTARGSILARDVIVATNGYTSSLTPWMKRRVIPIGSYVIATEPLARGQMDRLIPNNRMICDTRRVVFYYRSSPDRQRVVFGGRVSHDETDPLVSGPKLHANMVQIFPELAQTRISHSWVGFVGYTFDTMAHLGQHDGIYYAMGYCGSGVSMAGYFGMRVGQQLLGLKEGKTGFDGLSFQTRPLYNGTPWFLSASVMYYRWLDRFGL